MFNLSVETHRLQQLQHDRLHGLPYKRKQYDSKVKQVDGTPYEVVAQQESIAISHSFKNKSRDFGRRLSKAKGEKHHPGGGYAGHTIKGVQILGLIKHSF